MSRTRSRTRVFCAPRTLLFFILFILLDTKLQGSANVQDRVVPFLRGWLDPRWVELLRYLVLGVKKFNFEGASLTLPSLLLVALGGGSVAGQMRGAIRTIWGHRVADVTIPDFFADKFYAALIPLMLAAWSLLGIHLRIWFQATWGEAKAFPELIGTTLFWSIFIATLYKLLAPIRLSWKKVFPGALITSFIMCVGRDFTEHYLLSKDISQASGIAGDLLAFLLIAYFFSQLFLIGAELTHILATRHSKTSP